MSVAGVVLHHGGLWTTDVRALRTPVVRLGAVVRRLQQEVREVVRREGLITRRGHPRLVHAIKALKANGELVGAVFENDRQRQNALVLQGWTVLRFTWRMLQDEPERVVAQIRAALRTACSSAR